MVSLEGDRELCIAHAAEFAEAFQLRFDQYSVKAIILHKTIVSILNTVPIAGLSWHAGT
jgi:hypothetical protein